MAEALASGTVEGEPITQGWMVWPLIPYSYNTVNDIGRAAPSPPEARHLLGTDDTARDVLARVIYGFRLSITFALMVTFLTSGDRHRGRGGAGLFRRGLDLIFQRVIEFWTSTRRFTSSSSCPRCSR
jgi:microcin C transport system permease protein